MAAVNLKMKKIVEHDVENIKRGMEELLFLHEMGVVDLGGKSYSEEEDLDEDDSPIYIDYGIDL